MLQAWRVKLREADEAFRAGRLEEASRLLSQDNLQQFLPAKQLLAKVAAAVAARGLTHATAGASSAGWRDLEAAAALGADFKAIGQLRQQLVDQALIEAERFLQAGDIDACLSAVEGLERHKAASAQARQLKQAARRVDTARRLARQGKFIEAEEALAEAAALRDRPGDFAEARETYRKRAAQSRYLQGELHRSLAAEEWSEVLSAADQLLDLAPQCGAALDARRRAWNAVGMSPAAGRAGAKMAVYNAADASGPCPQAGLHPPAGAYPAAGAGQRACSPVLPGRSGRRFVLWVDGVGGYLVCEGPDVMLGQPAPDGQVDIPILADISRHHVRIRREGEGYLLTPLRPTMVNGRPVSVVTSLADNNLIELGGGVALKFRRPHPLSSTARLELVSRHRLHPAADGVLLLADSCILGPGESHHVTCHGWSRQVVIFRQGDGLFCRTHGSFEIDSRRCEGQGALGRNSQVSGHDFSFSLEEVG